MTSDFNVKKYQVVIEGISPVRQSRYSGEKAPVSLGGRKPTDEEAKKMFDVAKYWEKGIGYYQPVEQIRKTIINGAKQFKVPGKGQTRFSYYVASGGLIITPERLVHKNQKDVRSIGYFTTRLEGKKQTKVWTQMPEIHDWELEFQIENTMPELITSDYLRQFIEWAGLYSGIGVGRPERGNMYGRFKIKAFKEIQ